MKVCTRCWYPSHHPLHLTFDQQGVCSGCRVHEEKDELDWPERGARLGKLLDSYRCRSGKNYDCIVPVSGARDSYFIVHTLKHIYGLNPLLVTYNKHYNTDRGVRNLAHLRIAFNCDILTLTLAEETVKKMTRASLRRRGSLYWHCLAGQTVFPVQIACRLKIPLIVWGAHQGVDQVGMFSHLDEVEMTRKYRKEHDLMGLEAEDLIDEFDGIEERDIHQLVYPDSKLLEQVGVRGIYLNNYLRWDTKAQHESMLELYGYETADQNRTFDTYNDVDCFNYSDVHDYTKWVKHGYTKVTDHANREIRLKRLNRQQARELILEHRERPLRYLWQFCQWLGISENAFHFLLDEHRNPGLWERNQRWEWELKADPLQAPMAQAQPQPLESTGGASFQMTDDRRPGYRDDRYILIGKGYPE
jgi:N-acetyl sugar amidotransferase